MFYRSLFSLKLNLVALHLGASVLFHSQRHLSCLFMEMGGVNLVRKGKRVNERI